MLIQSMNFNMDISGEFSIRIVISLLGLVLNRCILASRAYVDFLLKWGVIQHKVDAKDLVTNELIDEVNTFDPHAIAAEAKSYKPVK